MKRTEAEWRKWIPISIIAIILMIIYKTIDNIDQITSAIGNFLSVISPLLFGILFTYFLLIPHRTVEKLLRKVKIKFISKRARGFSTILIFVILLCIIVLVMSFVVPIVIENIISLVGFLQNEIPIVLEYFDNLPADSIWINLDIANTLKTASGNLLNIDNIGQVAQGVVGFVGGIFSLIMGLVISLYILLDRDRIATFSRRLNAAVFKREDRINRSVKYLGQVNKVLFTFIASKGLDSIINFIVSTTVLLIFGVPYALLLGLIAGIFNFIPYLGSIISAFVISIITLITCDLGTAIQVMICLLVFHQIDGNFIEPRIMKSSLKINPILVIIAVVIGGAYFGIVGMFLAVPFAVIIKQLLIEYMDSAEKEKVRSAERADHAERVAVAMGVHVEEKNDAPDV